METYAPEEVKQLLTLVRTIDKKTKRKKTENDKIDKQIRYLEQRLKFFNPTKEMLGYIIGLAENGKAELNPVLLQKLKDEFSKKI